MSILTKITVKFRRIINKITAALDMTFSSRSIKGRAKEMVGIVEGQETSHQRPVTGPNIALIINN